MYSEVEGTDAAQNLTTRDRYRAILEKLRIRFGKRSRQQREEARQFLFCGVTAPGGTNLALLAEKHFGAKQGVDLELPPRSGDRRPPDFGEIPGV